MHITMILFPKHMTVHLASIAPYDPFLKEKTLCALAEIRPEAIIHYRRPLESTIINIFQETLQSPGIEWEKEFLSLKSRTLPDGTRESPNLETVFDDQGLARAFGMDFFIAQEYSKKHQVQFLQLKDDDKLTPRERGHIAKSMPWNEIPEHLLYETPQTLHSAVEKEYLKSIILQAPIIQQLERRDTEMTALIKRVPGANVLCFCDVTQVRGNYWNLGQRLMYEGRQEIRIVNFNRIPTT